LATEEPVYETRAELQEQPDNHGSIKMSRESIPQTDNNLHDEDIIGNDQKNGAHVSVSLDVEASEPHRRSEADNPSNALHESAGTMTSSDDLWSWIENSGGYSRILDFVPVPILVVDKAESIIFFNGAVSEMIQKPDCEGDKSLAAFFPYDEERSMITSLIQMTFKEGEGLTKEGFLRTGGQAIWGRVHVHPLQLGEPEFVLVIVENLTAEKEYRAASKSKKLLSMFPTGVAEFSLSEPISHDLPDDKLLSGILNAQLVEGNNEFARLHGSSDIEDLAGLRLKDLSSLDKDSQDLYLMWIRRFLPTGSFEFKEVPSRGKIRHIEKTLIGEVENNMITSFWELTRDVTERKLSEQKLKSSFDTLKRTLNATVEALIAISEKRDPYTAGHQRRVAKLAFEIAVKMGLSEHQCTGIHMAASIHDLGKIYVPAEFLTKPGTISEAEHVIIRTHPNVGYDILKGIEFPWPVAEVILQHHERIDGTGYPNGLKGEEILLESRIVAVSDVMEAMSSHRPYRPSLGTTSALDELTNYRGKRYDPKVVDACLAVMEKGFSFI
jgi:PAS domain S-box-containing protein